MLNHPLDYRMLARIPLIARNAYAYSEHRFCGCRMQRLLLTKRSVYAEYWVDLMWVPCLQLRDPHAHIFIGGKADLDESEILYLKQVDQNSPLHITGIKKPRTWRGDVES